MDFRGVAAGTIALCALGASLASGPVARTGAAAQEKRSLVIIPNVDDDDGDGRPDSTTRIRDAARDDELLQVVVEPGSALPEGAVLRVEVTKPWDRFSRVLVRALPGGAFRPVAGAVRVAAEAASPGGVTLAIEASEFADRGRPPAFDVTARFETRDGHLISEHTLHCRVAPFFMSSCLDPADVIHVARTKLTERFVKDLEPLVREAGAQLRAFGAPTLPEHDIWVQDATEIGYASDGQRLLHVALRGNRGKKLDDLLAGSLLGRDSGTVRRGGYRGKAAEWIDWYGNLEVSPPVRAKDRSYPAGRIYAGTQGARVMHPDVIAFLEAQGVQAPVLWLDTSWLIIGHVDETVSWVPSTTGTPYRMLVPSPRLAVEILRKAVKGAPGCVLNRGTKRPDDPPGESPEREVAAVLNDKALMEAQQLVQAKIDGVRRSLQEGLGIADGDIIEIPVLFSAPWKEYTGRYGAETPNMVNGLLVGRTLIVPDPHGPRVNGRDVLLQAVEDRLEPIGCKVRAIDNFYPYHQWAGEVHCGTNATRRPPRGVPAS